MNNASIVGEFQFGTGKIYADHTGKFSLHFWNNTLWTFDVGEISILDQILEGVVSKTIQPTYEQPHVFWRTNGKKVVEVYLTRASFRKNSMGDLLLIRLKLIKEKYRDSLCIREGGTFYGYILLSEIPTLRRYIKTLTEGAPYPRAVKFVEVVEESKAERLIRIDRFPIDNRNSKTSLKIEKEFRQELIKSLNVEAKFGVGVDYYIKVNLETKLGLTTEERISESIKVSMEAEPGEMKEYIITWKEVVSIGTALFEVNDIRQKVPFILKSGLLPEVRQDTFEIGDIIESLSE